MGVIHWRFKNIFILLVILSGIFLLYKVNNALPKDAIYELIYGEDPNVPCNKYINYVDSTLAKRWPVIGILGPPGSGVTWLRYLIEQLSGLYTGGVSTQYQHIFQADGQTKRVVAVMAHDVESIPQMTAAIVLFRGMQDTVRSQFAARHGPGALLEAPMDAYYGKDWESFAFREGKSWAKRYRDYIRAGKQVLVLNYDHLTDSTQVKKQLIYISHFLKVPISHGVLSCLAAKANDLHMSPQLLPRPLKYGFQPFELLPQKKLNYLKTFENYTQSLVFKARDNFVPKVHV